MGQAKTLLKLALHPTCWSGQLKDYKSQRHGFCGLVISKVLNLLSSPEASYSSISRFFLGSEGVETASHLSGAGPCYILCFSQSFVLSLALEDGTIQSSRFLVGPTMEEISWSYCYSVITWWAKWLTSLLHASIKWPSHMLPV